MKKDRNMKRMIQQLRDFKLQFENPAYQRELETMRRQRDKLLGNPDRRCSVCQAKGTLAYCFHCHDFICRDCHRQHQEDP